MWSVLKLSSESIFLSRTSSRLVRCFATIAYAERHSRWFTSSPTRVCDLNQITQFANVSPGDVYVLSLWGIAHLYVPWQYFQTPPVLRACCTICFSLVLSCYTEFFQVDGLEVTLLSRSNRLSAFPNSCIQLVSKLDNHRTNYYYCCRKPVPIFGCWNVGDECGYPATNICGKLHISKVISKKKKNVVCVEHS